MDLNMDDLNLAVTRQCTDSVSNDQAKYSYRYNLCREVMFLMTFILEIVLSLNLMKTLGYVMSNCYIQQMQCLFVLR